MSITLDEYSVSTTRLLTLSSTGKNYKNKNLVLCTLDEISSELTGNYDHPLIFEYWLTGQGVDTKVFWKNCKSKYNGWGNKRKHLHLYPDKDYWVDQAFVWSKAIHKGKLGSSFDFWAYISVEWEEAVTTAQDNNRTILFGFGKYGDFK